MKRFFEWPMLITTSLVAVLSISALALGWQTNWGREFRRHIALEPMRGTDLGDASLVPAFKLPDLEAGFPENASRPIFMPTRRPVPPAATLSAMKKGQYILVGTSRTKEFGDSAMLKEVATNKTVVVQAGGTLQAMTVGSIGPEKVVLTQGEESEELVLKARPGSRPASASASPAAPGMTGSIPPVPPGMNPVAPGAGIFGGTPARVLPPAAAAPAPAPGAAPGTVATFPGAPGSSIPATPGQAPTAQPGRPATPEEILERRRRARALQAAPQTQ